MAEKKKYTDEELERIAICNHQIRLIEKAFPDALKNLSRTRKLYNAAQKIYEKALAVRSDLENIDLMRIERDARYNDMKARESEYFRLMNERENFRNKINEIGMKASQRIDAEYDVKADEAIHAMAHKRAIMRAVKDTPGYIVMEYVPNICRSYVVRSNQSVPDTMLENLLSALWTTQHYIRHNEMTSGHPHNYGLIDELRYANGKLYIRFKMLDNPEINIKSRYEASICRAFISINFEWDDVKEHKGMPQGITLIKATEGEGSLLYSFTPELEEMTPAAVSYKKFLDAEEGRKRKLQQQK